MDASNPRRPGAGAAFAAAPERPSAPAPAALRKLHVTVLCGGPSAERDVSLESGRAVAEALRRRGHAVQVADINPQDLSALDIHADVIFPALHGTFGEDGQLQRLLEERHIPFVGSGVAASALAIDKAATKALVEKEEVLTPRWTVWKPADLALPDVRPPAEIGLPCVVKPVDQGSSVLTTICRDARSFRAAADAVIDEYGRALIEQFIGGSEITVGILGDVPLPPICIRPRREFYDFHAKYQDDATEYDFDAGISRDALARVQALSRRVFGAVGCRHLARVDWMLDADNRFWFLEINTLPGFTSHSLVPKAAAQVGIPFDELCDRLVRMPLEAQP